MKHSKTKTFHAKARRKKNKKDEEAVDAVFGDECLEMMCWEMRRLWMLSWEMMFCEMRDGDEVVML